MTRSTIRRTVLSVVLGATLWGCAGGGASSGSGGDALADLSDGSLGYQTRIRAIEDTKADVDAGLLDRAAWRESVKKVAWGAANYEKLRLAAIEALLEDDEADTRNMLRLMLAREPQWPVIGRICELAGERGWTEYTPALVRSWSRPVVQPADPERPERAALIALHPGREVEEVVFEVFATPSQDKLFGDKAREEAWALLCRLDPSGSKAARYLVTMGESNDPLLVDLRAGARDLRAAPTTPEQLQWLRDLRRGEHAAWWAEATVAVSGLGAEQLEGFELRHVAGVRWAAANEPGWLTASRSELISRLQERLSGRKTQQRLAESVEGSPPPRERLSDNLGKLVWGDALLILIADRAIAESDVLSALHEQADLDREDISTEHGGVLDWGPSGFVALSYPPRPAQRIADNRFVASPELLEAGAAALFHYHFHARKADESEYAGPGPGDMDYAERFGRSCLVFTSLNKDTLNVDYYQPNGGLVDLGEALRP